MEVTMMMNTESVCKRPSSPPDDFADDWECLRVLLGTPNLKTPEDN